MTICQECGEKIKGLGLKNHYQKEHPKEYERTVKRFQEEMGIE